MGIRIIKREWLRGRKPLQPKYKVKKIRQTALCIHNVYTMINHHIISEDSQDNASPIPFFGRINTYCSY